MATKIIELTDELAKKLAGLAQTSGQSESEIIERAVELLLEEARGSRPEVTDPVEVAAIRAEVVRMGKDQTNEQPRRPREFGSGAGMVTIHPISTNRWTASANHRNTLTGKSTAGARHARLAPVCYPATAWGRQPSALPFVLHDAGPRPGAAGRPRRRGHPSTSEEAHV